MGETADLKNKDTLQIHADIDRTRAEMSEAIEEIKERLSPEHIKTEVKNRVQDATVGRAKRFRAVASDRIKGASGRVRDWGTKAVDSAKHNPSRLILVGTGIGAGIAATLLLRKRKKYTEEETLCECPSTQAFSTADEQHPGTPPPAIH